jgi:chitinase
MWFHSLRRSPAPVCTPVESFSRSAAAVELLEQRRLMSAAPSVSVGDLTVTEGSGGTRTALVDVSLSAASNKAVAVSFRTENGSALAGADYQAVSGTLTFAPGQTRKTVAVLVFGDRTVEANETFAVRLLSTSRGKIADAFGTVTVVDDEPRVSISDVYEMEGCGCGGVTTSLVFTVSLETAYDQPVSVNYATADNTATAASGDYRATSGALTFAPGETTKTIAVEVFGDTAVEFEETFFVGLGGLSPAGSIVDGQATGWIGDDDGAVPPGDPYCTPDHPYYPNC